jgi:hypothetical protein
VRGLYKRIGDAFFGTAWIRSVAVSTSAIFKPVNIKTHHINKAINIQINITTSNHQYNGFTIIMPATKRSHDESTAYQPTKRQCRQGPSHSEVDVRTHHRYNLRKRHRQNVNNDTPPSKKQSVQPAPRRRAARPLSPVSSSASSLTASAPCTPPHVPATPQSSPPLAPSQNIQESYWFPPISALEEPQEFPDLKFFTSFRCTFLREINSSETASVLLIALPDGSQRILKLFFAQPEDAHDPGTNEYFAYCCLIAQGVCRPPSHSAAKRIVPYCYGGVVLVVCFFFCPLPIGCFFSRCFFSWTGGTRRAVWLKLSPRGLAHALAGGLAQAFAARSGSCFRRRSCSSFRRAPCFRRRMGLAEGKVLLGKEFDRPKVLMGLHGRDICGEQGFRRRKELARGEGYLWKGLRRKDGFVG